jgi:N-methylhydantoinase A
VGQGSETNVPLGERDFTRLKKEEIRKRFDRIYEKLYGRTYPDSAVEFINFKVRAGLPERLFKFSKLEKKKGQSVRAAIKGERPAYSGITKDFIPYTVYDRYKLFSNATFKGPAIIEEKESTLIVGEDATVSVDEYGFIWVDLGTGQGPKAKKMKTEGPKAQPKTVRGKRVTAEGRKAGTKKAAPARKTKATKSEAKTARKKR